MALVSFLVDLIHPVVPGSGVECVVLNVVVHLYTPRVWPGYRAASIKTKLAWCSRVVSAIHVGAEIPVQNVAGERQLVMQTLSCAACKKLHASMLLPCCQACSG